MLSHSSRLQRFLAGLVLAELKAQHLSQAQLAKRAKISEKHLTRLFSGESAGSLGVWDDLLTELGVKIWPDVSPRDV